MMKMSDPITEKQNLGSGAKEFLGDIGSWAWSDLLVALGNSQHLLVEGDGDASHHIKYVRGVSPTFGNKETGMGLAAEQTVSSNVVSLWSLQELVDEIVERLVLPDTSSLSSKSTSFRSSCDSGSTVAANHSLTGNCWWFDGIASFNVEMVDLILRKLLSAKFDQAIISRFLFYYRRIRVPTASSTEKISIIEKIIDLLYLLDMKCVSLKGLFGLLRVGSSVNISERCRDRLENMIGSMLDQATVDDLLIRPPHRTNCVYNVDLVLRIVKIFFLDGNCKFSLSPLKKVGRMIDLYATEIAADVGLHPMMFSSIVSSLPDSARDSCDRIYQAIDVYFQVHQGVEEKEKLRICSAVNYAKLSPAMTVELAQNTSFPLLARFKAKVHQNSKYKLSTKDARRRFRVIARLKARNSRKEYASGRNTLGVCYDSKYNLDKIEGLGLEKVLGKRSDEDKDIKEVYCIENVMYLPKLCS